MNVACKMVARGFEVIMPGWLIIGAIGFVVGGGWGGFFGAIVGAFVLLVVCGLGIAVLDFLFG